MPEETINNPPDFQAGYIAIIGDPNVGKSTLMNRLLGRKISIVSSKPQTTRHRVLGILSRAKEQLIFLDTPGLLQPKYLLHEAMMKVARSAVQDADLLLLMVDASDPHWRPDQEETVAVEAIRHSGKPVWLAINKIDISPAARIPEIIEYFEKKFILRGIFQISALTGTGITAMANALAASLPAHPPYYPADTISDRPEKFFAAEIIREKIFVKFRKEIPYSTSVDILEFKEQPGKKDLIRAEIFVERDSQKGILIGKKGAALKEIGELARMDIEQFLGRPVYLELYVKVRENWRENDDWLRRLGYESKQ